MTAPYFAYGSNLSPRGMGNRCPSATILGPARLAGWGLHACAYSSKFPGGVFTIVPDPAGAVWGLLWDVSERDVSRLDAHEGEVYERRLVTVEARAGAAVRGAGRVEGSVGPSPGAARRVEAWVYAMRRPGPWKAPRADHLAIVLEEGMRHQFPQEYLLQVEALGRWPPSPTD